jgi:hypothetical protein
MNSRTMKFRAAIFASAMAIASTTMDAQKILLVNDFGAKCDSVALGTATTAAVK